MIINSVTILFIMKINEKLYELIQGTRLIKKITRTKDKDRESNDDERVHNKREELNKGKSRDLIGTIRQEIEDIEHRRQQDLENLQNRMESRKRHDIEDLESRRESRRDNGGRKIRRSAQNTSD